MTLFGYIFIGWLWGGAIGGIIKKSAKSRSRIRIIGQIFILSFKFTFLLILGVMIFYFFKHFSA